MRKKMLMAFLLLLAGCFFISNEAFSAWTQAKGHSYNSLTLSYYKTTKTYTTLVTEGPAARVVNTHTKPFASEDEEFTSTKITYYGEYGITDKITAILSVPYDWQRSNDTLRFAGEAGPSGIGDINLGLRHKLVDNILGSGVLSSAQVEVKVPEAYRYDNPLHDLSLGDGQYDTTLAILFGRGLPGGYIWVNAGYKWRFKNSEYEDLSFKPSDQIKVTIGGGYTVSSWLMISGTLAWTNSVGDAKLSNELIDEDARVTGGRSKSARNIVEAKIIKFDLALEPDVLNAGIDFWFGIKPKWKTVLSYNRDLRGWGDFGSKNWSLGETVSIALVYMH